VLRMTRNPLWLATPAVIVLGLIQWRHPAPGRWFGLILGMFFLMVLIQVGPPTTSVWPRVSSRVEPAT
jgi:hypothetical protein